MVFIGDDISYPVIFWGFFHDTLIFRIPIQNKPIFQWKETRDDNTPWNLTSEGKPLKMSGRLPEGKDDIPTIPFFGWFFSFFLVIFYTSLKENTFKIPPNVSFRDLNFLWWFCCDPNIHRGRRLEIKHQGKCPDSTEIPKIPREKKAGGFLAGLKKPLENPYNASIFPKFMGKIEKLPKPRWFKVTCLRRVMVIFNPPPSVKKGHETWQSLRFFLRRFRSSAEAVSLLREENVYISWISWNYWVLDPRIVFDHKFPKKKSGGSLVMVLKWFWSLEVGFIFLLVANATITYTPED